MVDMGPLRAACHHHNLALSLFLGIFVNYFFQEFASICSPGEIVPTPTAVAPSDGFQAKINFAGKPQKPKKVPKTFVRPRYYSTELGIRERLFMGVMTSESTVRSLAVATNKTSSHYVDKLMFFMDAAGAEKAQVINLKLPGIVGFVDAREILKPFHMLKYLTDNYLEEYDFFFLTRDTTYVNPHLLIEMVKTISVSEEVHRGFLQSSDASLYCSLDSGILLSNSILKRIRTSLDWCVKNAFSDSDDDNFGRCILHATQLPCKNMTLHGRPLGTLNVEGAKIDELNILNLSNVFSYFPLKQADMIYKLHLLLSKVSGITFDLLPITGWKPFPSRPIQKKFEDMVIYDHIIKTAVVQDDPHDRDCSEEDDDDVTHPFATGKSLTRGRRYFVDGHIKRQDMTDNVTRSGQYCLKATVKASMNKRSYPVTIVLHKDSAKVMDADCECRASAMARCSHVCGLLIALQDYTSRFGFDPESCTSKLCSWNQGRKDKSSHPAYEQRYTNVRDPARLMNNKMLKNLDGKQECDKLKLIVETNLTSNAWSTILEYQYDDYALTQHDEFVLQVQSSQLLEALKFGFCLPSCIDGTLMQAESDKWHNFRRILITASKFTAFLANSDSDNMRDKIRSLTWEPKHIANKYTQHGLDNEETARIAYQICTGNSVVHTGLWINPGHPGLAASPDGIVACNNTNTRGLLEIKCSYVLKDHLPVEIEKLKPQQKSAYALHDSSQQQSESRLYVLDVNSDASHDDSHPSYLFKGPTSFILKKSHKWRKQIQMQLGITDLQWCDLCVWTEKGVYIERVYKDSSYWETVSQQLAQVFWNYICPEYFHNRIPRGLPLLLQKQPLLERGSLKELCILVLIAE